MTDAELDTILTALEELAVRVHDWAADYDYDPHTNEYTCKRGSDGVVVSDWFEMGPATVSV
jgi:hypothetical protein